MEVCETWRLVARCEGGGEDDFAIEAEGLSEAIRKARSVVEDWVRDGQWGDDGALVNAWWELYQEDDDEPSYKACVDIEIEPDHRALITEAGGDPDCDHDWTSEGEGGCDENPGVWSLGGTAFAFASHCRKCGLRRGEVHHGSQRNPCEHDGVAYEQPSSWCPECEREDCTCAGGCDEG